MMTMRTIGNSSRVNEKLRASMIGSLLVRPENAALTFHGHGATRVVPKEGVSIS